MKDESNTHIEGINKRNSSEMEISNEERIGMENGKDAVVDADKTVSNHGALTPGKRRKTSIVEQINEYTTAMSSKDSNKESIRDKFDTPSFGTIENCLE
eukprot:Pgem_evm1s16552